MSVRAGGATIRRIPIDHVVARHGCAPMVVVEGSGEVKGVGGAVALRPVVRIVEMRRGLIAAEPAVVGAVHRQIVVGPRDDGLPIAPLQERDREVALRSKSLETVHGPHLVRFLVRPGRVELGPSGTFAERQGVADLREKLLPALMPEPLTGRASFHGAPLGDGVDKGVRRGIAGLVRAEVRVPGEPLRGRISSAGPSRLPLAVRPYEFRQGRRRNIGEPIQGLRKGQRAARPAIAGRRSEPGRRRFWQRGLSRSWPITILPR